jgi:mRNA interferase MazF
MSNCSRGDIVLVRYPFTDLSGSKVRPAVIVSTAHPSTDILIVPLTSQISFLLPGEFILKHWKSSGLNVESAVKRGIYTVKETLIMKNVGHISQTDQNSLNSSLRLWLGF